MEALYGLMLIGIIVVMVMQGSKINKNRLYIKQLEHKIKKMESGKVGEADESNPLDVEMAQGQIAPEQVGEQPAKLRTLPRIKPVTKTSVASGAEMKAEARPEDAKPSKPTLESKVRNYIKENKLFSVESIISKLGIGLLLIGVGFIYKLAYDNGFITPWMAIMTGYLIGGLLLFFGRKVSYKDRNILAQVLFGGGVAVFYIVTFAAFNSYQLIGNFLTVVGLCTSTLLAFFIALYYNQRIIGIIALIGGLLVPFLVGISYFGMYGMGLYLLFIALGTSVIYFFKKWKSLQIPGMVGIYFVLNLIADNSSFSNKESIEYGVLVFMTYLIFYMVELIHHMYHEKHSRQETLYSAVVLSVLPFISTLYAMMVVQASDSVWAMVFGIMAAKTFILDFFVFRKKKVNLITNLLMGFVGIYLVLAVLLYFGGQVRGILILLLSVIFVLLGKKMEETIGRYIGLAIYGVGFLGALVQLFELDYLRDGLPLVNLAIFAVSLILMIVIGLLEKAAVRKVIGTTGLLVYMTLIMLVLVDHYVAVSYELEAGVFCFILLLWIDFILMKKWQLTSRRLMVLFSLIPALYVLVESGSAAFDDKTGWLMVALMVFYGLNMYAISLFFEDVHPWMKRLRFVGHVVVSILILIHLSIAASMFGIGLIVFAGYAYLVQRFEKSDISRFLIPVYEWTFVVLAAFYGFTISGDDNFLAVRLFVSGAILVMTYLELRQLIKEPFVVYASHMAIYSLYVFTVFNDYNTGVTTLFLAAYGIGSLLWHVSKSGKREVYLSMGYILLIAVKLIIVDLSSVEIIWKIVTSMAFGIGLLVLSYVIQPLINKESTIEDKNENME